MAPMTEKNDQFSSFIRANSGYECWLKISTSVPKVYAHWNASGLVGAWSVFPSYNSCGKAFFKVYLNKNSMSQSLRRNFCLLSHEYSIQQWNLKPSSTKTRTKWRKKPLSASSHLSAAWLEKMSILERVCLAVGNNETIDDDEVLVRFLLTVRGLRISEWYLFLRKYTFLPISVRRFDTIFSCLQHHHEPDHVQSGKMVQYSEVRTALILFFFRPLFYSLKSICWRAWQWWCSGSERLGSQHSHLVVIRVEHNIITFIPALTLGHIFLDPCPDNTVQADLSHNVNKVDISLHCHSSCRPLMQQQTLVLMW